MKLKYNYKGETHEIPLTTDKPQGKRLAVRHDNQTYYAPFVDTSNFAASDLHIVFGGDTLALSSGAVDAPVEIVESFNFSDNANPAESNAVTLLGNYGDFGVIADSLQPEGYNVTLTNGTAYYRSLVSITATQPNTTIIGSAKVNKITIVGGNNNCITGGLTGDIIYFNSGGGVINDFGVGATSDQNKKLASTVTGAGNDTLYAYDRTNPNSYARGADTLQFNGTVTAISFAGYGNKASSLNSHFTPTIHYTDTNDNNFTVVLENVQKRVSLSAYTQDSTEAAILKIQDMHTGSMKLLSSASLKAIFTK